MLSLPGDQPDRDHGSTRLAQEKFSFVWFAVWTLGSGFLLFWVYPVYYLAKKQQTVYLLVEEP